MARSTEQVFLDHTKALLSGDFANLMADYAEDAVLMTMDGPCAGKMAIGEWFGQTLSAYPDLKLSITSHRVHGDYVLVTWTGESGAMTVPHGVDTFVIRDDRIRLQTVWMDIVPR